jgi:hypothetical protein
MLLARLLVRAALTGISQRAPAKSVTKVTFALATDRKADTSALRDTMAPLQALPNACLVLQVTNAHLVRRIQYHAQALWVATNLAINIPPLVLFVQLGTAAQVQLASQ